MDSIWVLESFIGDEYTGRWPIEEFFPEKYGFEDGPGLEELSKIQVKTISDDFALGIELDAFETFFIGREQWVDKDEVYIADTLARTWQQYHDVRFEKGVMPLVAFRAEVRGNKDLPQDEKKFFIAAATAILAGRESEPLEKAIEAVKLTDSNYIDYLLAEAAQHLNDAKIALWAISRINDSFGELESEQDLAIQVLEIKTWALFKQEDYLRAEPAFDKYFKAIKNIDKDDVDAPMPHSPWRLFEELLTTANGTSVLKQCDNLFIFKSWLPQELWQRVNQAADNPSYLSIRIISDERSLSELEVILGPGDSNSKSKGDPRVRGGKSGFMEFTSWAKSFQLTRDDLLGNGVSSIIANFSDDFVVATASLVDQGDHFGVSYVQKLYLDDSDYTDECGFVLEMDALEKLVRAKAVFEIDQYIYEKE